MKIVCGKTNKNNFIYFILFFCTNTWFSHLPPQKQFKKISLSWISLHEKGVGKVSFISLWIIWRSVSVQVLSTFPPNPPSHARPHPHGDGPCRPDPGLRNERDFEKGSANSINILACVYVCECVLSLCVFPTRTRFQCGQSFRILILSGILCCFDIMLSKSSDPLRGFACPEKNKEGS